GGGCNLVDADALALRPAAPAADSRACRRSVWQRQHLLDFPADYLRRAPGNARQRRAAFARRLRPLSWINRPALFDGSGVALAPSCLATVLRSTRANLAKISSVVSAWHTRAHVLERSLCRGKVAFQPFGLH